MRWQAQAEAHHPRRAGHSLASPSPCPTLSQALWMSQARGPGTSVARNAPPESPRPSRRSCRPDPASTHLSAFSEVMGPFRSTFPKPRRQAASPLQGSATPRIRGRLSGAAGCGQHTVRWSPTVTTMQSTRPSEPWRCARPARARATAPMSPKREADAKIGEEQEQPSRYAPDARSEEPRSLPRRLAVPHSVSAIGQDAQSLVLLVVGKAEPAFALAGVMGVDPVARAASPAPEDGSRGSQCRGSGTFRSACQSGPARDRTWTSAPPSVVNLPSSLPRGRANAPSSTPGRSRGGDRPGR
jgi:hypothetical protein